MSPLRVTYEVILKHLFSIWGLQNLNFRGDRTHDFSFVSAVADRPGANTINICIYFLCKSRYLPKLFLKSLRIFGILPKNVFHNIGPRAGIITSIVFVMIMCIC